MAPSVAQLGSNSPPGADAGHSVRRHVLYIDAYDSFSYNVVAMLEEILQVSVTVLTIDSAWPGNDMARFLRSFSAVVLGPGPGNPTIPSDVGVMKDIWDLPDQDLLPVLGICLGFQSLCLNRGASISRLPWPLHGQVYKIQTADRDIFEGMASMEVTLYHSLYADLAPVEDAGEKNLITDFDLLAWLPVVKDVDVKILVPMAARHKRKPFWGVQFHPESCKSDRKACTRLLRKWWEMALDFDNETGHAECPSLLNEMAYCSEMLNTLPTVAFTMLKWSALSSERAVYRKIQRQVITAEKICEHLNGPRSPTVLFQDSGRYSIISVLSAGSWRLEYYAQLEKLLLWRTPAKYSEGNAKDTATESRLSVPQFWDVLRHLMERKRVTSGSCDVPFWGGFLGYFSYEMGLACLPHPEVMMGSNGSQDPHQDPPDVSLLWTERSIVVDGETGQTTIQSTDESDGSQSGWLDEVLQQLSNLSPEEDGMDAEFLDPILRMGEIRYPDEQPYKGQVNACKAELEAGESYELCLTCETTILLPPADIPHHRISFPWELYKRLRKYNPAAFSAYAKLGRVKIASSSPECFLTWNRESTLSMKPMKGTVRKSDDMTMERAKEILGSTKEVAENLMIADLIRHDLYGICGSGGVHVEKLLEVEDHGKVYQMVTHVSGEVDYDQPGFSVRKLPQMKTSNMSVYGVTALQKCLPPGSMTGAPKERSCIRLLPIEARKRGIYSGVMGYLDLGGGGSFSVLIRTAFTCSNEDDRQLWRIGAGGAVTALSTAEGEWDEMLTKLRTVSSIFKPLQE